MHILSFFLIFTEALRKLAYSVVLVAYNIRVELQKQWIHELAYVSCIGDE